MFEMVTAALGIVSKKKGALPEGPERETIIVTLGELSTLWLKYNNSFQDSIVRPSTTHEIDAPDGPEAPGRQEDPGITSADKSTLQGLDDFYARTTGHAAEPGDSPSVPMSHPGLIDPEVQVTVHSFYDDVIEPYSGLLTRDEMLQGVNEIVRLLKEYGDGPSVLDQPFDSERSSVSWVRDSLSKVSVRDHSFRVTRIAVTILIRHYAPQEPIAYIPAMLIAALGHDLGKLRHLRKTGRYATADHPVASVSIVESIFPEHLGCHTMKVALKAILEHHKPNAGDTLTQILKEADGQAREQELLTQMKNGAVTPLDKWLDIPEFLKRIGKEVNVTQTGDPWRAFSLGDAVYCQPEFLYETIRDMALAHDVIDITLLRTSGFDDALKKIVGLLRAHDAVAKELEIQRTARNYEVQISGVQKAKRIFCVPLKVSAFANREEFEQRRESHPPLVVGVKVLVK